MDKKLLREKIEGYRIYNEWEEEEERRTLPRMTIQDSLRQFLELQRLMRQLAPDARQVFFEDNLAQQVEGRARFRRIATAMKHGSLVEAVRLLSDFLNQHGIRFMLIGGLANAVWGRPRATTDADLVLVLGERSIGTAGTVAAVRGVANPGAKKERDEGCADARCVIE